MSPITKLTKLTLVLKLLLLKLKLKHYRNILRNYKKKIMLKRHTLSMRKLI